MADQNQLDSLRNSIGDFNSIDDLFNKRSEVMTEEPAQAKTDSTDSVEVPESDMTAASANSPDDLMAAMDSLGDETESENIDAAGDEASESDEGSLPSDAALPGNDSTNVDIETVTVKGPEGRKQKLEIDYSDKKAIKNAFIKAAGMRKFQAERDAAMKSQKATSEEFEALKTDFDKIEAAFSEHGAKGIVALLGGEAAWEEAVNKENEHREYVANLSAEEKYQLELKQRDEVYQRQLSAERQQREQFQQQIAAEKEQAELRQLQSMLEPSFDRYRFAGKLGDESTENLYDEAIWSKVKSRLGELPDDVELTQAVIDKEFRTVASQFKKHIKSQTEKQLKKTVENKKAQTAQRAQVAAKKGLSGQTTQRKILESIKSGNLSDALGFFKQQ